MKNKLSILIIAVGTFVFSSCKDDHDHKHEDSSINIEFLKPNANQEFDKGDTIFIKAIVKSDSDLHYIYVEAKTEADNSVLLSKEFHSHDKEILIEEYFINNLTHHTNVNVSLRTTNHDKNETARKEIKIHCHE